MTFTDDQKKQAFNSAQQSFKTIMNSKEMFNVFYMMSENYHRQLPIFKEFEQDVKQLIDLIQVELKY